MNELNILMFNQPVQNKFCLSKTDRKSTAGKKIMSLIGEHNKKENFTLL